MGENMWDHKLDCVDRRLHRAMRYIARDLSSHPCLAEVASAVGLERCYLSRLFRKTFGFGFSAWNRCIRVQYAKALLNDNNLSIPAIAVQVGYQDPTTFRRNFRKCTGLAPRQYRQERWKLQKLRRQRQYSPHI